MMKTTKNWTRAERKSASKEPKVLKMPFWSRKKEPHPETTEALMLVKKELETGTVSVESDTWRTMANQHVLNCIMDDIEHNRISSEDISTFERYNEMTRTWKKEILTTLKGGTEGRKRRRMF